MAGTSGIVSRGSALLRNLKALLFLFTLGLALAPPASGQTTTATLSGTVLDKDGFAVPQAKVVVTNRGTKAVSVSAANGAGVFTFPGLSSGDFTVTITAKGFETFIVNTVHLDPGDTRSLEEIRLKPGNVVIQRGTNHAWHAHGGPASFLAVLIDRSAA